MSQGRIREDYYIFSGWSEKLSRSCWIIGFNLGPIATATGNDMQDDGRVAVVFHGVLHRIPSIFK